MNQIISRLQLGFGAGVLAVVTIGYITPQVIVVQQGDGVSIASPRAVRGTVAKTSPISRTLHSECSYCSTSGQDILINRHRSVALERSSGVIALGAVVNSESMILAHKTKQENDEIMEFVTLLLLNS